MNEGIAKNEEVNTLSPVSPHQQLSEQIDELESVSSALNRLCDRIEGANAKSFLDGVVAESKTPPSLQAVLREGGQRIESRRHEMLDRIQQISDMLF